MHKNDVSELGLMLLLVGGVGIAGCQETWLETWQVVATGGALLFVVYGIIAVCKWLEP